MRGSMPPPIDAPDQIPADLITAPIQRGPRLVSSEAPEMEEGRRPSEKARRVSGGTGHSGRITRRMPDRVNDDLALCDLVENQERVGRRYHTADRRIVRAAPNVGMQQQKIGESLDAGLDPPGALWRMGADVIED